MGGPRKGDVVCLNSFISLSQERLRCRCFGKVDCRENFCARMWSMTQMGALYLLHPIPFLSVPCSIPLVLPSPTTIPFPSSPSNHLLDAFTGHHHEAAELSVAGHLDTSCPGRHTLCVPEEGESAQVPRLKILGCGCYCMGGISLWSPVTLLY